MKQQKKEKEKSIPIKKSANDLYSNVIPTSFRENEGRRTLTGVGEGRKRIDMDYWEMIKTKVLNYLQEKRKRESSEEDVRGVAAGGAVKKSKGVRAIKGKEMT